MALSACAVIPEDPPVPSGRWPDGQTIIIAAPDPAPAPAPVAQTPPPPAPPPPVDKPPPVVDVPAYESPLRALPYWSAANHRPALSAFKRSCEAWTNADGSAPLNSYLADYGTFDDWRVPCGLAGILPDTKNAARQFFEDQFTPVTLFAQNAEAGLLTGYYQPEIDVRRTPTAEFSEPILAVPTQAERKRWPRSMMNPATSRVIAYGRPLDVFFMQIQGSGHIRFSDGRTIRAAYAGNNGFPYVSIGRVLINRGALTKDRSSKDDIEAWMRQAGPEQARALMNENKRYIFFTEQAIAKGEGPLGAMRVPLTAMGSMAVDPRYHPYGVVMWLTGSLPQYGGDYRGREQGILLVAQDTGKAIQGAMRGDLYFGSGDEPGTRAGVMKHPMRWTLLLPRDLARRLAARGPVIF